MTRERRKSIPIEHNHTGAAPDERAEHDESVTRESAEAAPGPDDPVPPRPSGPEAAEAKGESMSGDAPAEHDGSPADDGAGARDPDRAQAEGRASIEAERDGYLDDLRRLKAEFENYRRRTQKELNDVRARARGAMILEFLPVLDNLERALDASEHHEEAKLADGVRMTHRAFVDLLAREGVETLDPEGEEFDPELHEALFAQASEAPEGTVIYVMEKGYVLGDRVLRPAKVAVSSGPDGGEG